MKKMSRYDQRQFAYISPTWQDEWLGPEPARVSEPDTKGVPVARWSYMADKPPFAQNAKRAWSTNYAAAPNSFYGNSPHWDYPWLDVRDIEATLQPALFSCFDQ